MSETSRPPNEIDAQWRSYCERVPSTETTPAQMGELRRAFFMGALGLINVMVHSDRREVRQAVVHLNDGVREEIRQFVADVERGLK